MKRLYRMILPLLSVMLSAACNASSVSEKQESSAPVSDIRNESAVVSYLGPAGTYTEEAAMFFFGNAEKFIPEESVDLAIADVVEGKADYAVIPQENTLGGAVTNYIDALIAQEEVYVRGEVILPISQTLLGVPGASLEKIQKVYSHAQGIKQSETWRKEHLPEAAVEEMSSTAAAAEFVASSNDPTLAAIAAPGAAELYHLDVLAENVQITDANKTRFYVIGKEKVTDESCQRAALLAVCEASKLDDILIEIHETGAELVTLHDRPEGSALGKYRYIIEIENAGGFSSDLISRISEIEHIRFLGSFVSAEKGK